METEIRFFFSEQKIDEIKSMLKKYKYLFSALELTVMYDNPNPKMTFYNLDIDGRLRLRTSNVIKNSIFGNASEKIQSFCLLTWKRRLPSTKSGNIRREEEIECTIDPEDSENIKLILSSVLRCPRVSSYERIRHNFDSDCAKITCDQFPYGVMLEFELKSGFSEEELAREVVSFGLQLDDSSKLSCDDMYFKLCNENKLLIKSDILFNDPSMPKIL